MSLFWGSNSGVRAGLHSATITARSTEVISTSPARLFTAPISLSRGDEDSIMITVTPMDIFTNLNGIAQDGSARTVQPG
jgi:hypothetical protein